MFMNLYYELRSRYLVYKAERALEAWRKADEELKEAIKEEKEYKEAQMKEAEERYYYY